MYDVRQLVTCWAIYFLGTDRKAAGYLEIDREIRLFASIKDAREVLIKHIRKTRTDENHFEIFQVIVSPINRW